MEIKIEEIRKRQKERKYHQTKVVLTPDDKEFVDKNGISLTKLVRVSLRELKKSEESPC